MWSPSSLAVVSAVVCASCRHWLGGHKSTSKVALTLAGITQNCSPVVVFYWYLAGESEKARLDLLASNLASLITELSMHAMHAMHAGQCKKN